MTAFRSTSLRRILRLRLASRPRREEDLELLASDWKVPTRSAARVAAVYGQRYAGDHRGGIAEQEHNRSGDLGLSRPTSQWHLLEKWPSDVLPTPVPRRHWRHDYGRIDRVDADVVLAQFQGGHPGDAVQGRLGCAVRNVSRQRDEARLT